MNRTSNLNLLALILVALCPILFAAPLAAQTVLIFEQELDFDEPEAWAMKHTAALATMTGLGVAPKLEPWELRLAAEGSSVPSLSEDERRVGFGGVKVEDLNRTSVFGRVRLQIGLPAGFSATVGYVPPLELSNVEPNFLDLSLERALVDTDSWRLGLRIFGQTGTVSGDFTCDRSTVAAGSDRALNPFGCEQPSKDEISVDSWGAALGVTFRAGQTGNFWPYLSASIAQLDAEFQVNARYSGLLDQTLLLADGSLFAVTAGFNYQASKKVALGAELFWSPLDVVRPPSQTTQGDDLVNVRAMLSYRLR